VILEPEVKREQIEVVSPPLLTYDAILDAVITGRRSADDAAQRVGARAVATATAGDLCTSHRLSAPRYDRMAERFALTMDEQLTCGLHVHVTIASPDEGVAVLDRIRRWLPVLLALSANSPYWRGVDSGFASYRYQAWGRWPSAGPYDLFHDVAGYAQAVAQILESGVSLDEGMTYFDARLSTHAPTVEIRIMDVCLDPEDAAVLAVLIRALVETAAAEWKSGLPADEVRASVLRLESWRASRWGIEEELVHPVYRRRCAAKTVVHSLLAHVADHFISAAEAAQVRRGIREILRRGNGTMQQRRIRRSSDKSADLVAELVRRTHTDPRTTPHVYR